MDRALRALNRFGLGARIGERNRVRDPRDWLSEQLDGRPPGLASPAAATPTAIGEAIRGIRMLGQASPEERAAARRRLLTIVLAEHVAALTARVNTERPFVERLVAFWSNHLCISTTGRVLVGPLAGGYERDAIRPHVFGRFEDMVLASAKHPAMLLYLDNFQSVGPESRGAQAGGGRGVRGLNENYARELLELHTVGVDGGYSQTDVQELAKIFTGWTVEGLAARPVAMQSLVRGRGSARPGIGQRSRTTTAGNRSIEFVFRTFIHEPGSKTVLATRYRDDGVHEGERVIRALCRHPSTAQFVARKLVTHFVADDPPAAAIERIARMFRDSDGDLRVVSRALIDLPEAWADESRKFRTPQDWVVAMLRALDVREVPDLVPAALRQLRHPMWSPPAPNGFGDSVQAWADPDSLLNRAELARSIARRFASRQFDPAALLDVVATPAGDPLPALLSDRAIPRDEQLALAIASPAFQWR